MIETQTQLSESDKHSTINPTISDQGTLDESVRTTIMRDLRMIAVRLRHVLFPYKSEAELKNWDLWGPLMLCLTLACSMSFGNTDEDASLVFTAVFVIVWCGAAIVTINAALIGGKISFFQSVCVLGYCLFPINIVSLLLTFINNHTARGILVILAFVWSVKASVGFMAQLVPSDRKALAVYPVVLFFITLAWMVAQE